MDVRELALVDGAGGIVARAVRSGVLHKRPMCALSGTWVVSTVP
jgi:hypothetical protein